jgi:hypothetical protein
MRASMLVGLVVAVILSCRASGQEDIRPSDSLGRQNSIAPPTLEGRSNAAIEYFKVWDMLTTAERSRLTEAAGNVNQEPGVRLSKKQREACDTFRPYIDELLRVSRIPDCDWGLRYEAGWECLLPHVGFLRGSCRVLGMDAHRCLDENNPAGATERVAAMIRLSDQTRSDKIMISALVGAAMCNYAIAVTDLMLKENRLNPSTARTILDAFKAMPKEDIFGSTSAIQMERWMAIEWTRERYKGEGAGAQFLTDATMWNGQLDGMTALLYSMDSDRFGVQLDRAGKYYDAIAALWGKPDNGARLEELEVELQEGQFGLVARIIGPSIRRYSKSIDKARADLLRVSKSLEQIIRQNEGSMPARQDAPAR